MEIVLSGVEAVQRAKARIEQGGKAFPAGVFAEGACADKQPIRVSNMDTLGVIVEQAIGVSRTELGGNGAEIMWPE